MILRRWMFYIAIGTFCIASYLLYSSLETYSLRRKALNEKGKHEIKILEQKLHNLETELKDNEELIGQIRSQIYKLVGSGVADEAKGQPVTSVVQLRKWKEDHKSVVANLVTNINPGTCSFAQNVVPKPNIQMLDVYDVNSFDNPDGGAWKQGWDIQLESGAMKQKLRVFVVPHSHCDPGWIKTFERYYTEQTRHILDNMVKKLSAERSMKFIYAEVSFFERWWVDADDVTKNAVRELIKNRQFEIVTGGWVMTDEASAHYFAMVDQLIEGHQWLEHQLNYQPSRHWSIDPFGLSPTMAHLISAANLTGMALQRVHYSIKKYLAQNKKLEFMWRQLWSNNSKDDILTHVFPFYSYDIPHTCGPDPKICCQFDFARLPGSKMSCPWKVPPEETTSSNVEQRAHMLVDQWRKKSTLYATNALLIPLGDDFRYDDEREWDAQFRNYRMIMDFANQQSDWNIEAQFGTLNDYFTALSTQVQRPDPPPTSFPVLSGDFFTYADRDDHYWSGYFTTRPMYKRMDRVLIHYLRGAEIIYALALKAMKAYPEAAFPFQELFTRLVAARRALALFQHHDGITGTAKDHVVMDYANRLIEAVKNSMLVISMSTHLLLSPNSPSFDLETPILEMSESRMGPEQLPDLSIIPVSKMQRSIYLYNSLPWRRVQIVCLDVSSKDVVVTDTAGQAQRIQIGPAIYKFGDGLEISNTAFEVCFLAEVAALGFTTFHLRFAKAVQDSEKTILTANFELKSEHFETKKFDAETFTVAGGTYEAKFSSETGFMQSVKSPANPAESPMEMNFATYGTVRKKDKSGAYLFLPDGPAQRITSKNHVLFVDGPLFAVTHVAFNQAKHSVRVVKIPGLESESFLIKNEVDIRQEANYELVMQLQTAVNNPDRAFYTDLNAFQMIKRKFYSKIPLQGNVFPMASAAFMQDAGQRATLLTAQPLGVANLEKGRFEVFLDRRLVQDDNRGLGQGVTDNQITPSQFALVLEALAGSRPDADERTGYLSAAAHYSGLSLLHPVFLMYHKEVQRPVELKSSLAPLGSASFPCDIHLVNLRVLSAPDTYSNSPPTPELRKPVNQAALILHRFVPDCRAATNAMLTCDAEKSGELNVSSVFGDLFGSSITETSLTLMHNRRSFPSIQPLSMEPMDIRTFRVTLNQ